MKLFRYSNEKMYKTMNLICLLKIIIYDYLPYYRVNRNKIRVIARRPHNRVVMLSIFSIQMIYSELLQFSKILKYNCIAPSWWPNIDKTLWIFIKLCLYLPLGRLNTNIHANTIILFLFTPKMRNWAFKKEHKIIC